MRESPLLFPALDSFFFDLHPSSTEISEPLVSSAMDNRADELEFTFACTGQPCSSLVPADKIFLNGQIRPLHPFKFPARDEGSDESHSLKRPAAREQLRRLFSHEREWNSSWNSLEGIDPETYCPWRPRQARGGKTAANGNKKKKSEEPGNVSVSKRWKVKDLVCSHGGEKVSDEPLE